jgi:hypothetical protein
MRKIEDKNKIIEFVIELIYVVIGAAFIALGINLFLLPNKMTTGGASGIATVLYYVFNIPMGITTIIINIPLFIFAILKLGKLFTIKTIISTTLLSVFLDTFKFEEFANPSFESEITILGPAWNSGQISTERFVTMLWGSKLSEEEMRKEIEWLDTHRSVEDNYLEALTNHETKLRDSKDLSGEEETEEEPVATEE